MTESTKDTVLDAELKPKTKLSGKVVKTTLAGAIIDIGKDIPGIVHISQLQSTPVKRVEDVVEVGQSVDVWVRRMKADRVELTMIEPVGLDWKELAPQSVHKGKVARLESYGAFVDIGAERPGLVHISEMSHGYVKTPQEVVKEGDEIEVMVLDVDKKKKQIRLSMKAILPEPEEKAAPTPAERVDRKRAPKKGGKPKTEKFDLGNESSANDPTSFELAWQAALERANANKSGKGQKAKSASQTQEEILDRTLKNRLPTGG